MVRRLVRQFIHGIVHKKLIFAVKKYTEGLLCGIPMTVLAVGLPLLYSAALRTKSPVVTACLLSAVPHVFSGKRMESTVRLERVGVEFQSDQLL